MRARAQEGGVSRQRGGLAGAAHRGLLPATHLVRHVAAKVAPHHHVPSGPVLFVDCAKGKCARAAAGERVVGGGGGVRRAACAGRALEGHVVTRHAHSFLM